VPTTDYGKTRPLTQIEGDISKIEGGDVVDLPIPSLRNDTFFAFVNVRSIGSDGVRRDVPMVVRVGHDVFPGLALQILCQYWGVGPTKSKSTWDATSSCRPRRESSRSRLMQAGTCS
jgi:hypothetical protein